MSYCIVSGCSNRSSAKRKNWEQLEKENKDKKFSFHLLPKDVDRQNQWLEAVGLKNWKPCKTAAVCSAHFKEEDFELNLAKKRLKKDAIPHVHGIQSSVLTSLSSQETNQLSDKELHLESTDTQNQLSAESVKYSEVDIIKEEIEEIKKIKNFTDANNTSCNVSNILLPSQKTNQLPDKELHLESTDTQNQFSAESIECFEADTIEEIEEIKEITNLTDANCDTSRDVSNTKHRSTSVSPERIFNSPNIVNLREIYQKQIKSLKKQLYRATYNEKQAKRKVQALKAVVRDLQKRNSTMINDGNILRYLNEDVQELVKCGAKNKKTSSTPRRWKPSLFKLALSLYFYSPKTYNFLRYKFSNALPHPKTISKWCRTM